MSRRSGFSLIDMLVAIAIFGVLTGVALPHLGPRRMDEARLFQAMVGDLRMARLRAITSGRHVLFQVATDDDGANGYQVLPMKEADPGTWVVDSDAPAKSMVVPAGITVTSAATEIEFEFNTRGMLVSSDVPVQVTLEDRYGASRTFSVWPSGQVHAQ